MLNGRPGGLLPPMLATAAAAIPTGRDMRKASSRTSRYTQANTTMSLPTRLCTRTDSALSVPTTNATASEAPQKIAPSHQETKTNMLSRSQGILNNYRGRVKT
ncbi:hypothetical protein DHEL01_v205378 [Diaporthe helianthi]|uniref:Uncharacterized protein n=1 Tax=Diaporthe helianthi TaxID=158607 RepID=A0A2P5I143_DIAHE|nr:hypothetical protein DHEL01_v205378 [Diaporthe helianthi]